MDASDRPRSIPFAAVITPGTLTVAPAKNISVVESYVPQPNFDNIAAGISITNVLQTNPMANSLVYSTATSGKPAAISSTFQKKSYTLSFDGPALKCSSANESIVRMMSAKYGAGSDLSIGAMEYNYMSWIPGINPTHQSWHPRNSGSLDESSTDVARIFVMTNWYNLGYTWNRSISYYSRIFNRTAPATVVNVTECVGFTTPPTK